jgi:hypothetical protein
MEHAGIALGTTVGLSDPIGPPLNVGFESGIQIQSSERKISASLTFRWRFYFPTIHEPKGECCMFKCPFTTLLEVASPAKKYRGSAEAPIYMKYVFQRSGSHCVRVYHEVYYSYALMASPRGEASWWKGSWPPFFFENKAKPLLAY